MVEEFIWSCRHSKLYMSKYLTAAGSECYPQLLQQALVSGSPDSLCDSLYVAGLWQPGAPKHSIDTFSWDEFNKYYMRALCHWCEERRHYEIVIIRGRHSASHRSSSEIRINETQDPAALLRRLRLQPAINPFGANSGLTLTLREIRLSPSA
jgi:hypothetical protein